MALGIGDFNCAVGMGEEHGCKIFEAMAAKVPVVSTTVGPRDCRSNPAGI